jgi:hypothetical protein
MGSIRVCPSITGLQGSGDFMEHIGSSVCLAMFSRIVAMDFKQPQEIQTLQ